MEMNIGPKPLELPVYMFTYPCNLTPKYYIPPLNV